MHYRPASRLLPILLLLTVASCGPASPDEVPAPMYPDLDLPGRPNVLWLVAEDLSPLLPAFGDSTVETPTLSRLAREGVRYTHVFSVSGVCAPSRFGIATGLYPTSAGGHHMRTRQSEEMMASIGIISYEVVPPPEVRMMSEVMRRHGYYASNRAKEDYQFKAPATAWDESSRQAHWRNRTPGQPFFSIFNFEVTHESRVWAKADDSLRVDADLEVPIPPYLPDTEVVRTDVRRVYSNIKELDAQLGEVLAQLEADGLLDSTIVVFYADHGGPLPRQKRLLYDSGLHVPMIIRFPNAQHAGTVDDRMISFIDFAPTTFSLAGIEPPAYLEGQAFLGPYRTPPRRYIHAAADRFDGQYDMIRAVRDRRFKYLRNFRPEQPYYLPVRYREQMATMQELLRLRDTGALDPAQRQWFRPTKPPEELFDTETDPYELNNLAADPAYADTLARLRAEAERWMEAVDDKGFIPEPEWIERLWPGMEQPVTAPPEASVADGRVTLASATEGASIGYQVLGPDELPGDHWQVYTGPVALDADRTLVAHAHRIGFAPSETVRAIHESPVR